MAKKTNKPKAKKTPLKKSIKITDNIVKVARVVGVILRKIKATRDNDNLLYIEFWKWQGAKKSWTFEQITEKLLSGELAFPETIGRARRKLQELNPELRGKLWQQRHDAEKEMRNQMKMDFDFEN